MKWLDPEVDLMVRMEAARDVVPWAVRLLELGLFVPFLYPQRIKGFTIASEPHFDEESTRYFVSRLERARSYLEFGCGGSTILAVRRGICVTSVESDPYFLAAVKRAIPPDASGFRRLLYADIGVTQAWGIPVLRRKTPRRLEMWRSYCTAPWRDWPRDVPVPDLILVDGRFRVACALSSIKALAERGGAEWELLFDDYAGRPFYEEVERFARLDRMVGRMAVFVPLASASVDKALLDERLDVYSADWR